MISVQIKVVNLSRARIVDIEKVFSRPADGEIYLLYWIFNSEFDENKFSKKVYLDPHSSWVFNLAKEKIWYFISSEIPTQS